MGQLNRKIIAWSFYDLANTAFSALFVTFFYPFFIKEFLGGSEFQIGLVFGISMLLVGILVPFLGALSDQTKKRTPYLVGFTFACVIFTLVVPFFGLYSALFLGALANFCYHACLTIYNAQLIDVSSSDNIGYVSGFGTALGYVGTLLSLGLAFFILAALGWETRQAISAMFPLTALFFLLFSFFTFLGVPDKKTNKKASLSKAINTVIKRLRTLNALKGMLPFLASIFLYSNAVTTAILFLFLFGVEEIDLTVKSFMIVYIIFSLVAAIGSYFSGKIVDRWGSKKTLVLSGIIWITATTLLVITTSFETFVLAGITGGVGMGMLWTASRPMLVSLVGRKNIAEFFGYLELTGKFSGVIGPILFGFLASFVSYQIALSSLLIFFIGGLLFLTRVPNDH